MGCALPDIKTSSDDRYDALDHLTTIDYPTNVENLGITDESFAYDKVGNRENPGDPNQYDYNDNHQITKSPDVTAYSFDNDGNLKQKTLTAGGSHFYFYDPDSRLNAFVGGGTSATYQYDPFGRRISKTVGGVTTWFVWDGTRLIGEYDQSGTRTKRYAYLPYGFAPVQVEDGNGIYNVHYDHLQTPKFLTDSTQAIVWSQIQESFGGMLVDDNPDGGNPIEFNMRLAGQYFDAESGLYYNYFRTYDPALGRYIQSDPIGLMGGLNTYGYALQNPNKYIDPLGLVSWNCKSLSMGVSAVAFGGGIIRYKCTSECINGSKTIAEIEISYGGIDLGLEAGMVESRGNEITDGNSTPNTGVFNGGYYEASANYTVGIGYGVSAVSFNRGQATGVNHGVTGGIGIGVGEVSGTSKVVSQRTEECDECEDKK